MPVRVWHAVPPSCSCTIALAKGLCWTPFAMHYMPHTRHNWTSPLQVEGTEDPLDARVVLHGWFSKPVAYVTGGHWKACASSECRYRCAHEPRVTIAAAANTAVPHFLPAGSLSQEEAAPSLQAAMDAVHAALAKLQPAAGTVMLRLQVAGDGRPTGLHWLCNTVRLELLLRVFVE